MNKTVFFEVLVSNEHTATVVIRPATLTPTADPAEAWIYEVSSHHRPPFRGTVEWTGTDALALIALVLADYATHPHYGGGKVHSS